MSEEISFSGLKRATELKADDILAISQKQSTGEMESLNATVQQLAAMMPPGLPGEDGKDGKDGVNALANWAVKGGNWSSSYGPNLGNTSAHGHMGICEYWKTTLELDKAAKDSRPPFYCVLQAVPCTAGGEMLPFNLDVQYKFSRTAPQVIIVLMVFGEASQVLDLDSGKYSPLGLVEGVSYEPKYSLTYWY